MAVSLLFPLAQRLLSAPFAQRLALFCHSRCAALGKLELYSHGTRSAPLCFFAKRNLAMEHIVALLLIVGCSDDLATCQELPAPVAVFETAEACEAELPVSLRSFTGQYPQVLAKCVDVDPALEEEDAELVWDVNSDGGLYAAVDVPQIVVADAKDGRLFTGAE
jgi:hypothetical protein